MPPPHDGDARSWIEIVSYALIVLIGARLMWVKGRAFLGAARQLRRPLHAVAARRRTPHATTTSMTIMVTIIATITVMRTIIDHARPPWPPPS